MKYSAVTTLAIVASLAVSSATAHAGWGHLRGGGSSGVYAAGYGSSGAYGSSGSYGSSGTYGSSGSYAASYGSSGYYAYGSSGGSSGGPGVLARMAGRIHDHMAAKRARHAARRAAYGSSGYYASSGGSSGYVRYSYSSSGGSSGYSASRVYTGGSSGSVYRSGVSYGSSGTYGSVGTYYGASKARTSVSGGTAPVAIASNVQEDAVYLTVAVPSEAKIFVNGNPTTSTGAVREFVSRGLKPGVKYQYEVRAEIEDVDGQVIVEEQTVVALAGKKEQIQFAFAEADRPIETAVTLNVPEGAQVTLAGNATRAIGDTRTFRTSQLKPGDVWDDYEVEVRYQDQVKKQSIRLLAGDQLELTFAFENGQVDKLAAR